jgi:hypothetical protein
LLAFVDAVGVRDFGIGLRDAAPRRGATVRGSRNTRKHVALFNGDLEIGFQAGDFGGHHDFRAGGDARGVSNARVSGQQFLPARAAAEILLREFPEGIAGLNDDGMQWRGSFHRGGRRSDGSSDTWPRRWQSNWRSHHARLGRGHYS